METEKTETISDKREINVLLVEDDKIDRFVAERVLTKDLLSTEFLTDWADIGKGKTEQPELSGNVFIAEDVKANQILVESLLNKIGLTVTIAEDGNEAVQKALSHKFDLILMDIQMPNMNGYEATQALRQKGIKTPIIALTAYTMNGGKEKCIEASCDDYLSKPIDCKKLLEKLRKYLPLEIPDVSKQVDSIKSKVNELVELCSDTTGYEIVNWEHLLGLLGDEESIRQVVPVFLTDTKERFHMLAEAIIAIDTKGIERL